MAKDGGATDPLHNPRFQEPSVWQLFRESLFGKPRLLDCIQVEVTSVCPGRCVYCPHTTQAGYWRSRHMEAATFARLWPLMQESGRVHLQGWGEPFLHPRFMDFAALARKAGCRVSTTTCGRNACRANRGERHRHCGLFPRGHRRGQQCPARGRAVQPRP